MRRSSRIFINDLNTGKRDELVGFLRLCHDTTQYFVDLFWQRKDFSATLADLPTVHRGRDRFGITTRLAQALAKQAKETVRSAHANKHRKPSLRRHTATLCSHFVTISEFDGAFDYAIKLIGSGAPRMVIPTKSTAHLNKMLGDGWKIGKSIRLGRRSDDLYVDLLLEKPRPPKNKTGKILGMDSNYKAGLVFSDGQQVADEPYALIQQFGRRRKHTRTYIKSVVGHALKSLDLAGVQELCIEDLKHVKRGTRGKFPRRFNRRLSHWLYAYTADLIERKCEEEGVRLRRKGPWKTSQFCRVCRKWDRRNRRGDKFKCVHCGHSEHADLNAAKNLELLGLAGVYGLRSLPSPLPVYAGSG